MRRFWKSVYNILDDVLAYILTVVGILFSNVITLMRTNESFSLDVSAFRIVASMIIAFAFVSRQEIVRPDDEWSKIASKEGKKRNFKLRMSNALAQGMMWSQSMELLNML